jgi:uncharacterized protein
MRITSGGPEVVASSMQRDLDKSLLLLFLLLLFTPTLAKAQQNVVIHQIQSTPTSPTTSPYLGQTVITSGIVVGIVQNGFYIEAKESNWDLTHTTSDGIFVSSNSVTIPTDIVALGNELQVTGQVALSTQTSATSGLQISLSAVPTVVTQANPLPSPISLNPYLPTTEAGYHFGQLLQVQGMLATLPSATTVSATGGKLDEPTETVTSTGQFYAVASGFARTFRQTGFSPYDVVPAGAPAGIPTWTGNPQRILIDTTALGGTALDVTTGETITNLTGIVDYRTSIDGTTNETALLLNPSNGYSIPTGALSGTAAVAPVSGQITIATQDLGRFFDTSSTSSSAVEVTQAAYNRRLNKTASAIVAYENRPDIVAVQEVESLKALTDLSAAITAAAGAAGQTDPAYAAYWFPSNDPTGLGNGVLIKSSTIDTNGDAAPTLSGADATYQTLGNVTAPLFDHPPILITKAGVIRQRTTEYPLTIIISHMLERTHIDDVTLNSEGFTIGEETRHKREEQAVYLANLIQIHQAVPNSEQVIAVGNYNAFEFSDGYVDTMGIIAGTPTTDPVVLVGSSPISPGLVNLTTLLVDPTDRYTYVENGNSEQLDHVLITSSLSQRASLDYARVNADFPASYFNDATNPLHNADHDPVIGYFVIPQFTSLTLSSSENPSYVGDSVTFTARVTSPAGGTPTGTVTFYIDGPSVAVVTLNANGVARYTTSDLTAGLHPIAATYSGDLGHDPATSAPFEQTVVDLVPTITTLACTPNPAQFGTNVTCTATVSSALENHPGPTTGQVTFYDGTTVLGTGTLANGTVTYSTSSLSAAVHPISAVYARTPPYETSTSNTVNELIWADFSISAAPPSGSVYTGEKANYTVTATPGPGFTFAVPLSCTALPNNSSCSFNPASIAGGNGSSVWTVQTSAPSQTAASNHTPRFPWQLPGTIALAGVVLFVTPKRLRRRGTFLAIVAVLALNTMFGCGSPRTLTGGTPPGTYTVTVTANVDESGYIVSHSANVTLTVKSLF